MFQRSEIGKYRSKASIIEATLNKTFVTPNGNTYKMIAHKKEGKKETFTYECEQFPGKTIVCYGKMITLEKIMEWIEFLKTELKTTCKHCGGSPTVEKDGQRFCPYCEKWS